MANTNCLEGMGCPECKSEGPFLITVIKTVRMRDEGSEDISGDEEWDNDSWCICDECNHGSTVGSFNIQEKEWADQLDARWEV